MQLGWFLNVFMHVSINSLFQPYLFRFVALVDEPREHVAVVDGEVVPLAVDVGRDDRCEVAPVLIL